MEIGLWQGYETRGVNESSYSSSTRGILEFDSELIESSSNIIILDSNYSRSNRVLLF